MALVDFNHIKDVLDELDNQRPARFGYTEAAVNATGAAEIAALEGLFIVEDSTQINSIPTPDLVGMDPVILRIGLRTQASTISRMAINHFFGRLGLNLLKVTEKLKLLVDEHLVNRYITPSGLIMEKVSLNVAEDIITLVQHQSPLSASAPVTASTALTIPAAAYGVAAPTAGIMSGADKRKLDDTREDLDELIASVSTELDKITATQQQNLVYNSDFRYFSNRLSPIASWYSYKHPDGWVYADSGTDGKIGWDTDLSCCKFQTSSDGSGARAFSQALHEFVNWKNLLLGKTVTLKAFVKGANATVRITDGVTSQSAALQNTGGIEEITLQIAVSAVATELTVLIESSTASNIIEIYKVYANRGNYAIETLPCIVQGKIGEISMFASERIPAGECLCDKSALSRTTYSRLFSVVQTKYGSGDGSTTFNAPGYKGLVPKGVGNATINGRTKTGPAALAEAQEDQGQGYDLHLYGNNANGAIGTYPYPSSTAGGNTYTSVITNAIVRVASSYGPPRVGSNYRDSSLGTCFYIKFA